MAFAGASADFARDRYVGIVDVVLRQSELRFTGTLEWELDHTFTPAPASPKRVTLARAESGSVGKDSGEGTFLAEVATRPVFRLRHIDEV